MVGLFLAAFGLSLAFAIQPGVIALEGLRRGARHGWRAALRLTLGSLIGDATWALAALTGASLLFQSKLLALIISLFGCGLLLILAWQAGRAALRPAEVFPAGEAMAVGGRNDFAAGALLSLSNPLNLTFWLGISGVIIGLGFLNPQPTEVAVFFAGFMLAQVLWCFGFAGVIALGRSLINPHTLRGLHGAAALALAYFGVNLLAQSASLWGGLPVL